MLTLGQLTSAWTEIAGISLAAKTCPARLIRGKLYLTVSDSQWMQTLAFLKSKLIEKISEKFPQLKINEIVGRPGKIPEAVEKLVKSKDWPDWKKVKDIDISADLDEETLEIIKRCRKKLIARLEGLKQKGLKLCSECKANMIESSNQDNICAICSFDRRRENLIGIRNIIFEMPWLRFDEVTEFDSSVKVYEFEAIKSELIESGIELVEELYLKVSQHYSSELMRRMRKEMVRVISLHTGHMPDQIDLDNLMPEQLLVKCWQEYLDHEQEKH
jgi:hypothetical protein